MTTCPSTFKEFIDHVAEAIARIDARRPQAANARTGTAYQPGIGPHPETQAVELIVAELPLVAGLYGGCLSIATSYPGQSRQRCDLCIGVAPAWEWAVEIKMLRLMGDNGKPNDNMLMHIFLSGLAARCRIPDSN